MNNKYITRLTNAVREAEGTGLEKIAAFGLTSSIFVLMNYDLMNSFLHRYLS